MSEMMPSQNEDPLPLDLPFAGKYTEETQHRMPHTAGELVVENPKDPFIWLASHYEACDQNKAVSDRAKQVLWAIHQLDGGSDNALAGKTRTDELYQPKTSMRGLSEVDLKYIDKYMEFLERGNDSRPRHRAELPTVPIELHRPNAELALFAIAQNIQARAVAKELES